MALAIDTSTPAIKGSTVNATSLTSNSFSPPAGSLLAVFVSIDQASAPPTVSSMTDSLGSHLTWVFRTAISSADTRGEIWFAYCPNAQTNMTVTSNFSATARFQAISVVVLTGADSSQASAAVGSAQSASGTPSANLTTARAGSWVIGLVTDFTSDHTPTIPGGQTDVFNGNTLWFSYGVGGESTWTQGLSAAAGAPGSVTINDTAPTAIEYSMAIAEVLAATATAVASPPVFRAIPVQAQGRNL